MQRQGAAYPNISRITRALSPMYLSTIALETTFKKFASTLDATARARSVLPVPGGPYLQWCHASKQPIIRWVGGVVKV